SNAEADLATLAGGLLAHLFDLLAYRRRGLAPGQVEFDLFGCQILGRIGGSSDLQRRTGLLYRREQQLGALDLEVLAVVIHGFAFQYLAPDAGELHRGLVALGVAQIEAVTGQLVRITAGDQIEQGATVGPAIQWRRLTGGHRGGDDPGAQCYQELQALGDRDQRGGHQPGVLAGAPGGDQHPAVAQFVRSLGDLLQVAVIYRPRALGGAQVTAVAVGG